ncbi:MAG: tyrosine-type recombinase/integrase [Bradymonadia bacterium]
MEAVTFNEVADEYLDEPSLRLGRKKGEQAEIAIRRMKEAWGDRDITSIDDEDVRVFFKSLRKGKTRTGKPWANSYINSHITYYRAVMNYARDERRLIHYIPKVKKLPTQGRTTFLEDEQVTTFMSELDELRADMFLFATLTGARKENVRSLRIDQVSADGKWIMYEPEDTKNGEAWTIPLIGKTRELIEKRLAMVKAQEAKYPYLAGKIEYVFVQDCGDVRRNGKPLSSKSVTNHSFHAAAKRAGLKRDIVFHSGRHTFATKHKRKGTRSQVIMALGGWKSEQSMHQYSHVVDQDLIEATKAFQGLV